MSRWFEKYVTGGGCSKRVASDTARKRFSAVIAVMMAIAITCSVAVPGAYANPLEDLGNAISNGVNGITQQLFGISLLSDGEPDTDGIELYAAGDKGNKTVDPSTLDEWYSILHEDEKGQASTQNIGRIWTDKSVFSEGAQFTQGPLANKTINVDGDHDFLVGLSALSSTSNLTWTTQTVKPLDIVLVLDRSTSMNEDMTSGWYSDSRLDVLKEAVNNFIDSTAAANADIEGEANQHRISVITFSDNANTVSNLTAVNNQTAQTLKRSVNNIRASGNTYPNTGFEAADSQLATHGRGNAKKVVIFFTDGVPAGSGISDFEGGIAADAVNAAHNLKQGGTVIYSIGVFQGANPNDTDGDFNAYMNAVSSKYPNATAEGENGHMEGWWEQEYVGGSFEVTWNGSAQGDYYKTASDADELNTVFEDIFEELPDGVESGSPIQSTQGVQGEVPGTLTFNDTLGDYMEVAGDTMTLVYGGKPYTARSSDGGRTWSFGDVTVEGNDVYASANLQDITITVDKGTGSNGDTVHVSMPASLIPLRNYQIDTDTNAMTVSEAYPVRLFYGVSVKQDALNNLGDPSNTTLQNYINANKTDDGSVNFYANKSTSKDMGDAEATFTPSEGNKFYYFTEETPLFLNPQLSQRATERNLDQAVDGKLYFADSYWTMNADGATGTNHEDGYGSIPVNGEDAGQAEATGQQGQLVIPAHSPRHDRPSGLASNKADNATETANTVLVPSWAANGNVSQRLGNNGVIPVELPAQLSVTKSVEFGGDYGTVGFDETAYTNRSYQMTIHVDGASGNYKAQVTNVHGDVVSEPADGYFDIAFNNEGNATQSLKDGETLTIYGLDGEVAYTVTEETLGSGFTTEYTNESGTLAADGTSRVIVTNAYTLNPVTGKGSELFNGTKVLDGRDWAVGDTFTFQITGQDGAPTPTPNTVMVNAADTEVEGHDAATFNFGDVTYNMPGVYKYTIVETKPATAHPGMSYSSATYEVEVTVADKGDGTMTVTPKMTQTQADNAGDAAAGVLEEVNAVFTNHFSEMDTSAVLGAYKNYSNNSGNADMDLANDMFTIELRPTGENADEAPMPANVHTDEKGRFATTTNANINFDFGHITYDNMMDGKTFTYQIREVPGTVINMDYDAAVYTVQVTVNVNDQNQVSVDTKYFDANDEPLGVGEDSQAIEPTFVNEYDPTDATLAGEAAIHGDKTLTGRDMQSNETFGFTLAPKNQAAITGVNSGTISIADNDWTASVSEGKNGVAKRFAFGDMTFMRAGEYTFTVTETSHNGKALPVSDNVPGMTYDRDACTVTVTVTDEDGALKPSVSYNNGVDQAADCAVFKNSYTSSIEFGNAKGGINVTKKLTGRNMTAGEFAFSVTAVEADGSVDAKNADAKLAETDRSFTNPTGAMAGVASRAWKQLAGMTFNQDDAGKTFVYEVRETTTATDVLAVDTAVYTVSLTPHDNADGSMYVTGTVTKDGAEYAPIDTRTEDYTAPTLAFENVYTPKPISTSDETETTLRVTKRVTGAPAVEAFDFELTLDTANSDNGADGVFSNEEATQAFVSAKKSTSANIAADATETVKFDQLTFTKAGTYTFKVKETTTSDLDYWKYDTTERTITVEVSDNSGQLEILYAQGNNPTIKNKYDHGTVIIGGETSTPVEVKKAVTGWTTEADFNFTLAPADYNAEDPESVEHWSAVKADESAAKAGITDGFTTTDDLGVDNAKTAKFGEITFTEPGTYTFNVTEDGAADFNKQSAEERAGWTYDENTYQIVVEVTETNADGEYDGELHASITSDPVTFTNSYEAGTATVEGGEATFAGTKTIDGRNALADERFGFELSLGNVSGEGASWDGVTFQPVDGDEAAFTTASATATMYEGEAGPVDFWFAGTFKFAHEGTYTFNVTETQHNGADLPEDGTNGMTYDRHVGTITVEVTDNGSGTLQTKVTYGEDESENGGDNTSVDFVNSYTATPVTYGVDAMLGGRKYIDDTSGSYTLTDEAFSFILRAQDASCPMPDGASEEDDQGRKLITVKNGTGDLDTDVYDFGDIEFTHEDMSGAKPGEKAGTLVKTFQYNIFETGNMPAGISKDNSAYTVTFTVTEDQNTGTMSVEASAKKIINAAPGSGDQSETTAQMDKLDFTNTYDPTEIKGYQNIFKTMDGRNWLDTDSFTFDIAMTATELDGTTPLDVDIAMVSNSGTSAQLSTVTSTNDGHGLSYTATIEPKTTETGNTIRFSTGEITYTHVGIYTWTVSEQGAGTTTDGVTNSVAKYTVTTTITDENGALKRDVKVEPPLTDHGETIGDTLDFTNTYTATGTLEGADVLDVQKTFTGREGDEWTNNDVFTFKLTGFEGAPMPANDTITLTKNEVAEGVAKGSFGDIAYGNADRGKTYTYTITEVVGDVYGVDYSEAEYKVTVTVNDKPTPDGTLDIVSTVEKAKDDKGAAVDPASAANVATFTNTYKVNEDTKTVDRVDGEGVKTDVDGKLVGVGDTLEYTIHWVNDAVDDKGVAQDATVTVVDTLPAGVTLDQNSIGNGTYNDANRTITWTIEAKAAQEGDITYSVTVNDEALQTDELTNTATIALDGNDPKATVEATVDVPQKSVENDREDAVAGDLQVGDTLTYTIEYTNDTDEPATITVADPVPAGLTVTQDNIQDGGKLVDGTITWVIENVPAGKSGAVHFSGVVNETALTAGADNQATIQVGEDGPVIKTNTVPGTLKTGTMSISKTVVVDETEGTEIDTSKLFEFAVNLTDSKGNALTGTYTIKGAYDGEGNELASVTDGTKVYLHHDDHATVEGLPAGTHATVTETVPDGYKVDKAEGTGVIVADADTLFAFTNTYSADPTDVPSTGETEKAFNLTKQLTGRDENNSWSADDEFSFTLTPGKATDLDGNEVEGLTVPMPADSADGIKKVTVGADMADENGVAPIDFGAIRYERTGIYTYTVTEENGGNTANGITYDGRTVNIKVTVIDNGTGGLVAAVEKTDEAVSATDETKAVSFKNTYDSTFDYGANGQGGIDITKMLKNRDMTEGQFTFTVTAADKLAAEKIGGEAVKLTSAAAAANTAASVTGNPFGSVTFDRADSGKTFTYTIAETGTAPEGYKYDTDVFTVEIKPVDNGDGTMRVTTQVTSNAGYNEMVTSTVAAPQKVTVPFVNTYDAGDVTIGAEGDATLAAKKVLENDDIANYDGDFTFKVTSGDTVVATGKNGADGSVKFDTITYTSENLYAAAHGGSDKVGSATLDTTGDKDVYTFVYNVSEDPVAVDGVTYKDGNDGSVTVTVTDDRAGNLDIKVAYSPNEEGLVFTNTYGAGEEGTVELTLDGNKALTGVNGAIPPTLTDGMFEFTISSEEGTPMPADKMVTNKGTGISFGPIEYTMANVFGADAANDAIEDEAADQTDEAAAGETATAENGGVETYTAGRTKTFIYTITEVLPEDDDPETEGVQKNGITYDATTKTIEVTVTDEGDGKISAAVTKVADGADENMDFTFDNTYAVEDKPSSPTGDGALTITKKLSGRDMNAGEFTFQLVSNSNKDEVYTATNDADGNVSFDPITFIKEGEYSYTLTEVVPEGAESVDGGYKKDGVFYPTVSYTVTARVTDNQDGTLTVAWSMVDANDEATAEAVFENTYTAAPASASIEAAKALEGRAVQKDEFSFKLFDADGNVVDEATNDENGVISFDSLTFENAGTYTYMVSEVVPEEDQDLDTDGVQNGGITYDQTVYTVEIVVKDNGKGSLVVDSITYKIGDEVANALLFTNIYKTQPTDPTDPTDDESWLKVTKELANRDLEAGEFTFQMRYVSGGNADAVTPKSITTTNDANGNVVFDQEGNTGFVFSEEGEYTFIISEIEGDDANIDYDDTEYTVVAKVTKNAETGELEVVWQLLNAEGGVVEEDPSITFHNVYKKPVTPPTPEDPDPSDPSKPDTDVDKKLTGRDLVDGEFSFTITVSSDNASHVSPKSLTGTNDASGNVTFGGKGFVFEEAGDYTFIVAEVLPSDDDPDTEGVQHNGVTYDPATFTITAHVTEQNGKLVVTWESADAPMVFENEYEPSESVDITFGATKALEGRDLAAGEFSFELRDQDGNVVATATNAADGSIVFTSPVTFTEPGEYTYTIVEVSGNVSGVTYDDAVHTAVVTVTDNGDGTLSATVTYDGSGKLPVFTNVFTPSEPSKPVEPEKPSKPGIPQTGDFAVAAIGGTGLAAAALIATGLYLRRRNNH